MMVVRSLGRLGIVAVLIAVTLTTVGAPQAHAQFPEGPITLVVPFTAGGGTELVGRVLVPYWEKHLGVPVNIELMPGSGSAVGNRYVARANPDGYTLLLNGADALSISALLSDAGYSKESFRAVGSIAQDPAVLAVLSDSPWQTMEDVIAYARENPGRVTFSNPGAGTNLRLVVEIAAKAIGVQFTSIPFDGTGEAIAAVLGGHIHMVSSYRGAIDQLVADGRLRALVTGGRERYPDWPDVPTYLDLGYDVQVGTIRSIFAPAGIPDDRLAVLEESLMKAANDPGFIQEFRDRTGGTVSPMNAAELQAVYENLYDNLAEVITELGL